MELFDIGRHVLILSYSDFMRYCKVLQEKGLDYAKKLLQEEGSCSYEEVSGYLHRIVSSEFEKLFEKGIKDVVVIFPHEGKDYNRRTVVFVREADKFFHIVEIESDLMGWFDIFVAPLLKEP